MKIKTFHVSHEGLNRFFGPLEAKIMNVIWLSEEISITDVHTILNQETPISFNAVNTVMNRLQKKGHLKKIAIGGERLYRFAPVISKEQFVLEQTKAVTEALIQELGGLFVNHIIETLVDTDPVWIERLEQKLSQLKNREPS
ncbi:BlaI/MecI/CopY family transcriptional regulator [Paenibacillus chondroitinus]|uniref:BlaI/MecI/CopY family transcriptional regulator n=1 Tax=Paenibacillus chondroitinus TaxID=59842 RepID=A0ABU6DIR0_9BACL|nr:MULTISPECIES: BlaI/MecI/CopY family transcriptional regulator [Paenibacillus]MCY9659483.1 BlaI/MecI/CopY family transcriptional regulator [Paenibacillus anseongense]MEB4796878.1 BlaI/MecI/CopY family transcriptional regulator [Paenibacillus chondroitinus]